MAASVPTGEVCADAGWGAAYATNTERLEHRAYRPQEQTRTMDRALLWTVAHELRAPLSALTIASEVLAEDAESLTPRQIGRMARTIQGGALWLQTTVENILCSVSLDAGGLGIRPERVALAAILSGIQPVVEPLLTHRNQRLSSTVRGAHQYVLADRRRIGQVLVNLISNASKYSPCGSPIDVTISAHQGRIRLIVADRGPGVPSHALERVFDPFYRTSEARDSGEDGMGLGLAIVKAIIHAHGGTVGVENRLRGGAIFWFELSASSES